MVGTHENSFRDLAPQSVPNLPTSTRFAGHLRKIAGDNIDLFERCEREHPIIKLRVYHVPVFVISDPALIGEVLVAQRENFEKPRALKMLRRLFGQGLLSASHDVWKRQQRTMRFMFQPRAVVDYGPAMAKCIDQLLGDWDQEPERDVLADMTGLTLRMACDTLFGPEAYTAREAIYEVTEATQDFFTQWRNLFYLPFPEAHPTPTTWRYRRAIAKLDRIVYELIAERRAQSTPSDDMLAMLVHARDEEGKPMSDRQIRDEAVTLFLAAHETTAAAATWGLEHIASTPTVAQKCVAELNQVLRLQSIDAQAMRKLPYLMSVVKEILRLHPSIPVLSREAITECEIGGFKIRRGGEVLISPWAMQRSERYFSEPERFMPARWTQEFERELPRWAYFPFGGGNRVCIGQHMATQELMMIFANVLRRASIVPAADNNPQMGVGLTMTPVRGSVRLRVSVKPPETQVSPTAN
jgi:cytochrome P450